MIEDLLSYEQVMHNLIEDLKYDTVNGVVHVEDDIRRYASDYSYYINYLCEIEEYESAASLRGALVLVLMSYHLDVTDAHKIIKIAIKEHE